MNQAHQWRELGCVIHSLLKGLKAAPAMRRSVTLSRWPSELAAVTLKLADPLLRACASRWHSVLLQRSGVAITLRPNGHFLQNILETHQAIGHLNVEA